MLGGLEISEVNSSKVLNEIYRLEAKFYTSKSFDLIASYLGEEILETATYNSVYGLNSERIGYPTLRMNEFDGLFTGNPTMFSDGFSLDDFERHSLKKDEILICRTNGNPKLIGKSALVAKNYPFAYESHLFKVRPKKELINSATLVAYLNTKYGRMEIEKFSMQGNQSNFSLAKFKEMRIPKLGNQLCCSIEKSVYAAFSQLESSQENYTKAEVLLLNTLGMENFSPGTEAINIKSFRDSFATTGRLDAEYYQPKYEDYQAHVLSYPSGWQPLTQACNLKDGNFSPDDATAYKYIELADIDNSGGITGCTEALGNELPSRARRIVGAGDVLISSIEGSLSSCAIVPEKMEAALCSTGFYVINSDKINSETLLVLFKSPLMQSLLKQGCSGTILTAINKTEFQNIPVPIIDGGAQSKIAALVQESFSLKAESERLLDVAKRAVEIAIEQDEDAGMAYIEENPS